MKTNEWFPAIHNLKLDGDSAEILLSFPEDLGMYKGHFSDFKITPGVVQAHCAVELFNDHLATDKYDFQSLSNVKFMRPILPDNKLTLNLKFDVEKLLLEFSFTQGEVYFSKGKVRLGLKK